MKAYMSDRDARQSYVERRNSLGLIPLIGESGALQKAEREARAILAETEASKPGEPYFVKTASGKECLYFTVESEHRTLHSLNPTWETPIGGALAEALRGFIEREDDKS